MGKAWGLHWEQMNYTQGFAEEAFEETGPAFYHSMNLPSEIR